MTQLDAIKLGNRPFLVFDIDEVVLEFLTPFDQYLRSLGHTLLPRSFRLHGNIVSVDTGVEASHEAVNAFEDGFYADQEHWQFPAQGAVETLHELSEYADLIFLTAMPPRFHSARRILLNRINLPFPMVATEEPKGKVLRQLHGDRTVPVVFVDDIAHNLESVRTHVPNCYLLHLMANSDFRKLAPQTGDYVSCADDWTHAKQLILSHIDPAN